MNKIPKDDYRYSMIQNTITLRERIFVKGELIGIVIFFSRKMHLELRIYFIDNYTYYRFINFNNNIISEYYLY